MKIDLRKTEPDSVSPEVLQRQLAAMGLTCEQASLDRLRTYIRDVREELPEGLNDSFLIGRPYTGAYSAGDLLPEPLLDVAEEADDSATYMLHTLTTSNPGTRRYLSTYQDEEGASRDFLDKLREGRGSAGSFLGELKETESLDDVLSVALATQMPVVEVAAYTAAARVQPVAQGSWSVGDASLVRGFVSQLSLLQNKVNFDYLKEARKARGEDFCGVSSEKDVDEKCSTVAAVKTLFVDSAKTASSTLIQGISKPDCEAIFSNALDLAKVDVRDYHKVDNRIVFTAKNYSAAEQTADGIGAIGVDWDLTIKDFKKKKEALRHQTNLNVTARGVFYSSLQDMDRDYREAKNR